MPMSHSGWAEWRRFSAAMLALVGAFNVVEGLVAIYDGNVVRVDPSRVLLLDPAGWAQVMLALGALLLALGIWLSMVTVRVRLVALSVVVVHALTQLGVLAAFPAWALLMISCDVVIIFALTATPAGAAASVARGVTVNGGTGEAREAVAGVPAGARTAIGGSASAIGGGRGGYGGSTSAIGGGRGGYGGGDRVRYRPRHQIAAAAATVVLGPPVTDAIAAGSAPHETAAAGAVAAPRALPPAPPAPPAAATAVTSHPATATMAGAVARTAGGTGTPAATGQARGVAAPIIGAISGRWPDASLR